MTRQETINLIRENHKKYSSEDIRRSLLETGYTTAAADELIKEALKYRSNIFIACLGLLVLIGGVGALFLMRGIREPRRQQEAHSPSGQLRVPVAIGNFQVLVPGDWQIERKESKETTAVVFGDGRNTISVATKLLHPDTFALDWNRWKEDLGSSVHLVTTSGSKDVQSAENVQEISVSEDSKLLYFLVHTTHKTTVLSGVFAKQEQLFVIMGTGPDEGILKAVTEILKTLTVSSTYKKVASQNLIPASNVRWVTSEDGVFMLKVPLNWRIGKLTEAERLALKKSNAKTLEKYTVEYQYLENNVDPKKVLALEIPDNANFLHLAVHPEPLGNLLPEKVVRLGIEAEARLYPSADILKPKKLDNGLELQCYIHKNVEEKVSQLTDSLAEPIKVLYCFFIYKNRLYSFDVSGVSIDSKGRMFNLPIPYDAINSTFGSLKGVEVSTP